MVNAVIRSHFPGKTFMALHLGPVFDFHREFQFWSFNFVIMKFLG